jgi:hypothetical protein
VETWRLGKQCLRRFKGLNRPRLVIDLKEVYARADQNHCVGLSRVSDITKEQPSEIFSLAANFELFYQIVPRMSQLYSKILQCFGPYYTHTIF